eukprot:7694814-Heterocapsa_arctica.AAC.1
MSCSLAPIKPPKGQALRSPRPEVASVGLWASMDTHFGRIEICHKDCIDGHPLLGINGHP